MATRQKKIRVEPESEVGKLLAEAAESGLLVQADGTRYRVDRMETGPAADGKRRRRRLEPKRIRNIIGLGESSEPSNIARLKDHYLAEAADHRGE